MKKIASIVEAATVSIDVNRTDSNIGELIMGFISKLNIVLGGIVMAGIVYAGFLFLTSGGSPEKVSTAKKALLYALIGAFLVAASAFLVIYLRGQARCLMTPGCNLGG